MKNKRKYLLLLLLLLSNAKLITQGVYQKCLNADGGKIDNQYPMASVKYVVNHPMVSYIL